MYMKNGGGTTSVHVGLHLGDIQTQPTPDGRGSRDRPNHTHHVVVSLAMVV